MNRFHIFIALVMMLGVGGVSGLHEQIVRRSHSFGNDVRCRCKRFT